MDDELTELYDAEIPRVDLVDKAANGTRFLIAKNADTGAGLIDPATVRELIGKSEPEPEVRPEPQDTVTVTGSPGAIVKMIHAAAVAKSAEEVIKAKYSAEDRKRMAGDGQAMADGSYPIADKADLRNAIHAVGRGGADHNAIRRHVISRAKALGASSEIPDNWNSDGSLKEGSVSKMTDMDATTVLAEPDEEAPGNDTDPGSPAWEAVDAATACKWTAILARAKNALGVLADREMLEAASADPSDAENAMDLDDACCAIDYAISVLAPYAVAEQAEADCCDDQMDAVGKALAGFDPTSLDTIEGLGHVAKAGRVLSSANEAAIRGAVESLQKVLASLPAAPTIDEPVTKQEDTVSGTESETTEQDVTKAEDVPEQDAPAGDEGSTVTDSVEKASKAPQIPVYNSKGKLVGVVDQESLTLLADDGDPATPDDAQTDVPEPAEPAEDSGDAAGSDLSPAPADEVGTPADGEVADDVAKGTDTPDTESTPDTSTDHTPSDVLKSIAADVVKAALDDRDGAQEQAFAKQAEALAHLVEVIDVLKDQVKALEEQPAESRVFTNGAAPQRPMLRGQDQGATPIDVAKARETKQSLYKAKDATEQNAIATGMQEAAIVALQDIHSRRS